MMGFKPVELNLSKQYAGSTYILQARNGIKQHLAHRSKVGANGQDTAI